MIKLVSLKWDSRKERYVDEKGKVHKVEAIGPPITLESRVEMSSDCVEDLAEYAPLKTNCGVVVGRARPYRFEKDSGPLKISIENELQVFVVPVQYYKLIR